MDIFFIVPQKAVCDKGERGKASFFARYSFLYYSFFAAPITYPSSKCRCRLFLKKSEQVKSNK